MPLDAPLYCFATRASREESPSFLDGTYRRPPTAALCLLRPRQIHLSFRLVYSRTYINTLPPYRPWFSFLVFALTSVCAHPRMFCDMLLIPEKLSCRPPTCLHTRHWPSSSGNAHSRHPWRHSGCPVLRIQSQRRTRTHLCPPGPVNIATRAAVNNFGTMTAPIFITEVRRIVRIANAQLHVSVDIMPVSTSLLWHQ